MAAGGRVGANGALERRRLGRTDIVASVLGFGGSEIGYQGVSAHTVARLLGGALDAGLNAIDTAECYEDSEILIAKAIGARRHELYLFTKCGHAGGWGRADWRRAPLLASIERSLRRLSTANVAWRYERKPAESYYQTYWSRLRTLDYRFLKSPDSAVATALRFTLSAPGVHTAIVGTTKPERWPENAALLGAGTLTPAEFERIRARWREVADASWDGQT